MLHHIVSWKMNGETAAERAQQARDIAEKLTALRQSVPTIAHLEVRLNELDGYNNWELVLISAFASQADFEAYVVHPAHQEVAKFIKEHAAARAGVDYTA